MKILVTNDDGIQSPGIRTLATELSKIGQVIVVAPDRERSAIGSAVTLRSFIRVHTAEPSIDGIEAYAVDGTPVDSVLLGLDNLANGKVDLVVSGINHGPNIGDDVTISGTVSAAVQAYLLGFSALAVSVNTWEEPRLDVASRLATLLARRIGAALLPTNILLNLNVPNLPLEEVKGLELTSLASASHINAAEESFENGQRCFRLIRQKIDKEPEPGTDIWAVCGDCISITPLHTSLFGKYYPAVPESIYSDLLTELRNSSLAVPDAQSR